MLQLFDTMVIYDDKCANIKCTFMLALTGAVICGSGNVNIILL